MTAVAPRQGEAGMNNLDLGNYTDFFRHFRAALEPSSTTKLVFDLTEVRDRIDRRGGPNPFADLP
ncbi:hypothetical protein [Kitasatospora cineracea]|uniref:hypothetical protein n=1 Tax=Kitasatospora cineracea TaxID=88074 RepID=UPI0038162407